MTDLYLMGSGVRELLHLTEETRQAAAICNEIYVLHVNDAVLHGLRDLCDKVVDVVDMYDEHEIRRNAYEAIAKRLTAAAAERGPVGFMVQGNPMFLVSATEFMIDLARQNGLVARVLPGVSSFDTILCDLEIDLGYGVQLFDTSTMLQNAWMPNPAVPMLLFQLATTLDPKVVKGRRGGDVLRPVVEHLQPLYGPEHIVTLIYSAATVFEETELIKTTIQQLATRDIDLTARPSLYVPAL